MCANVCVRAHVCVHAIVCVHARARGARAATLAYCTRVRRVLTQDDAAHLYGPDREGGKDTCCLGGSINSSAGRLFGYALQLVVQVKSFCVLFLGSHEKRCSEVVQLTIRHQRSDVRMRTVGLDAGEVPLFFCVSDACCHAQVHVVFFVVWALDRVQPVGGELGWCWL